MTVNPIYLAPFASALALVFAALQTAKIKKYEQGTEKMQEIARAVRN